MKYVALRDDQRSYWAPSLKAAQDKHAENMRKLRGFVAIRESFKRRGNPQIWWK